MAEHLFRRARSRARTLRFPHGHRADRRVTYHIFHMSYVICHMEYGICDMKVKLILPALTEAKSPFWRPIKYSLFPPLGLATLAGYLSDDDEISLEDEHVESLDLDDEPELVVIQVYITSAKRSYALADHYRGKGAY